MSKTEQNRPEVKTGPNEFKEIPLDRVVPPWSMMRPVQKNSLEWMEMVDSIRKVGILNSILVREHPTKEGFYEIIDGMWRYSAIKELDIQEIPCIIVIEDLMDEEFLARQISANAVSYETRPIEFAEQMERMIQLHDELGTPLTKTQLALQVGKSTAWVSQRLQLLKLCPEVQDALRSGWLTLGKATALARVNSPSHQKRLLAAASRTETTREFELLVGQFVSLQRDKKAGERREFRDEVTLKPRIQSMDTMLIELDRMHNLTQIIVQKNLTTAIEGAKIALEWVLNLHDEGRSRQVKELRHVLSNQQRLEILGRQRYDELKELKDLKQETDLRTRVPFYEGEVSG